MSLIQSCKCGSPDELNNAGRSNCLEEIKNPRHLVIAFVDKEDGTINSLDPASALDQTVFDGLFKNENPFDRWYIIRDVKNFTPEQADDIVEEQEDQTSEKVADGIVTHTYMVKNVGDPYKFKAKVESWECFDIGAAYIDDDGNFVGKGTDDQKLTVRRFVSGSLKVRVLPHTSTTTNGVSISFQFDRGSGDETVDYISQSKIAIDLTIQKPLIDANGEFVGAVTLTGGTYKLFMDWGGLQDGQPIKGFTTTEMEGFNEDDALVVALITFDEDPLIDAQYDYTHIAQDTTEKFHLQGKAADVQKDFDLKRLRKTQATFP